VSPRRNNILFNQERIKAYNIILEILMFHGIDPIEFRIIEREGFAKDSTIEIKYHFARHEYLGYSLSAFRQILTTSGKNLGIYERTPIPQQRIIYDCFMRLNQLPIAGNLDYTDIMNVYGDRNSWIYTSWGRGVWFNDKNVKKTLAHINKMRNDLKAKGIAQHLHDNWPEIYERFWVPFFGEQGGKKSDLYWLICAIEDLGEDFLRENIHSMDFLWLFKKLLRDHGYSNLF
jgi:hypothetical protein